MSDLPPRYLATMNTPGYLPRSDDRMLFDTVQAAWEYLAGERERQEDADTEECEYSDTLLTLRYISSGEHQHGNWHEDTPTHLDGSGTVYGLTPGYNGSHDLGIAYTVTKVEHAAYPHESGTLYDCDACDMPD